MNPTYNSRHMRTLLLFTKSEAMRFTSHLDLMRAIERNFRRAELPLTYSQGFNPRPKLLLASPLPLGFTSGGERAEAWLNEDLPLDEILLRLNRSAPPGIEYVEISEVSSESPKLPNLVYFADYRVTLSPPAGDLPCRISNLLEAESLVRERGGKPYDLRPMIETLSLSGEGEEQGVTLEMRLSARPGATGRPDEVVSALGLQPELVRVHRTGLVLSPVDRE